MEKVLIDTTIAGLKLSCTVYEYLKNNLIILDCPGTLGGLNLKSVPDLNKIGISSGTPILAAKEGTEEILYLDDNKHPVAFATLTSITEKRNGFFIYVDKIYPNAVGTNSSIAPLSH
ncbi:MAG: hypothetical protein JSR71_14325 [Proteobacteria bacterium]|nr:hypothetical protein [Pseudomonadota bacterium]